MNKFFDGVPAIQKNIPRLKPIFCTIFRENSIKLRQKFFKHELICILWRNYVASEAKEIRDYLVQLREQDTDQREAKVLINDIRRLSDYTNFEIFPAELLGR